MATSKPELMNEYKNSPDYISSAVPWQDRNALLAYKNSGSESDRNTAFQDLYKGNPQLVDGKLGTEDFQGYDGMRKAFNEAYPADGGSGFGTIMDAIKASQWDAANPNRNSPAPNQGGADNLPGANTNSALSVLHKK